MRFNIMIECINLYLFLKFSIVKEGTLMLLIKLLYSNEFLTVNETADALLDVNCSL